MLSGSLIAINTREDAGGREGHVKAVEVEWLVDQLPNRGGRALAQQITTLIHSGVLPVGVRLPAIRDIAFVLGVSPATVSIVWSELRRRGMITGRGRRGTYVSSAAIAPRPIRRAENVKLGGIPLDLSGYTPDPALLPPLHSAFLHVQETPHLNIYADEPIEASLEQVCRADWPYEAEALMATNGAYGGLFEAMQALIPPGSVVLVEDPVPMRVLDIIDYLKASAVAVPGDAHGPIPARLRAALTRQPVAFFLQPNLNAITGRVLLAERMKELADVLNAAPPVWIFEDDAMAYFTRAKPKSLGVWCNAQVIHVHSLSKALGPDLRLGILSASDKIIREIQAYRSFGSGWTSRIMQAATARLLVAPETATHLERARRTYQERRQKLTDNLAEYGFSYATGEGFSFWLPVEDEEGALASLNAQGIRVTAGRQCSLMPQPHIRFSISHLKDRYEWVSEHLAQAGLSKTIC